MINGGKTLVLVFLLVVLSIVLPSIAHEEITSTIGKNLNALSEFFFQKDETASDINTMVIVNHVYPVFHADVMRDFRVNFLNKPTFAKLNDDWYIISINQNNIGFEEAGGI